MGCFLFLTSFELGRWVKLEDLILEGEMRLSSPLVTLGTLPL